MAFEIVRIVQSPVNVLIQSLRIVLVLLAHLIPLFQHREKSDEALMKLIRSKTQLSINLIDMKPIRCECRRSLC